MAEATLQIPGLADAFKGGSGGDKSSSELSSVMEKLITSITTLSSNLASFKISGQQAITAKQESHQRRIEANSSRTETYNAKTGQNTSAAGLVTAKSNSTISKTESQAKALDAKSGVIDSQSNLVVRKTQGDRQRSRDAIKELGAQNTLAATKGATTIEVQTLKVKQIESANAPANKRQDNIKSILDISNEFDQKTKKRVIENLSSGYGSGGSGGGNSGGGSSGWGAAGFAYASRWIGKNASQGINNHYAMEKSGIGNPMMSGYNFGGLYETMNNLNAQKNAGWGMAAADVIGGGIGGIIGGAFGGFRGAGIGAGAGAGIANSIAQPIASWYTGMTSVASARDRMRINNNMSLEALRGNNPGAYNAAGEGLKGHQLVDIEVPFTLAISKATNLYNENSKAMGDLTKNVVSYAQATYMDLSTATAVGANAAMLSSDSSFSFSRMKQMFSSYGVTDYAGTSANAVNISTLGYGSNKSIELASYIGGLNPKAQQEFNSYFSSASSQMNADLVSQALGGNSRAYHDVTNPLHSSAVVGAQKVRALMAQQMASGDITGAMATNITGSLSYGVKDLSQIMLSDNTRKIIGKSIGVTGMQNAANMTQNAANRGDISADQQLTELKSLGQSAQQTSDQFSKTAHSASLLSEALSGITRIIHSAGNGSFNTVSGSNPQTKK